MDKLEVAQSETSQNGRNPTKNYLRDI